MTSVSAVIESNISLAAIPVSFFPVPCHASFIKAYLVSVAGGIIPLPPKHVRGKCIS